VSALRVVLLPYSAADAALAGRARVVAQSRRAREALARSAEASGAQLGALEKDAEDAPLSSNGWHWSISHGRGYAAGVVARGRVGLDVERVEARNPDVVSRVTTRNELELLGGFTWEAFVRVWTAKEAVLKKAGVGLLELSGCTIVAVPDAESMVVHHRDRDHLVHQSTRDHHVAAVTHDDSASLSIDWSWTDARADAPSSRGTQA
jgi:4'-phosphopantetheinyl transferase